MPSPSDPTIVVVLATTFPVPPDAGSPRQFHLLSRLAKRARLHCVVGTRQSAEIWNKFANDPAIEALFASVSMEAGVAREPRSAQPLTLLAGLPRNNLRLRDPDLLRRAQELTVRTNRERGSVLFLCMGIDALQLVPRRLWKYCVVDGVDSWSLVLERRVQSDAQLTRTRRVKLFLAKFGMRRFEDRIFRAVHAVAYNSSVDIAYLRERSPNAPIIRVIDGCDTEYFSPDAIANPPENADEIVFNGHMGYAPNLDGARHLADDVMPLIWQQRPETKLFLVGPDPSGALARYDDEARITATGFVDDVRPYLARAALVVSALRFGTGMKNKLQAGLAMKRAMVVSSSTAEGFDGLENGKHAVVTDEPQEFADAVCALLEDPSRRARMAEDGQQLIREHFSWDAATEVLWNALESCPRTPETSAG